MPSYEWFLWRRRIGLGVWILLVGLVIGLTAAMDEWPLWLRGIGVGVGIVGLLLIAVEGSDDRLEYAAKEDHKRALRQWQERGR